MTFFNGSIKPRNDRPNDECGVFGIYQKDTAAVGELAYYALYALQHRGQDSAGIAVSGGKRIDYHKGLGLVDDVFTGPISLAPGNMAIGHVYYSTGKPKVVNAQPFVVKYKYGELCVANNGRLINADELREDMAGAGAVFSTDVDAEIMANLIARENGTDIEKALENMMQTLKGAFAAVIMTQDKLIALRDPHGLRPLCIGSLPGGYAVASESCALDVVEAELVRDVRPGEIVIIDKDGLHSIQTQAAPKSALCVFEFVYLARTDSVIDSVSVHNARKEAGRLLARKHPVEADLVVGVPDSALIAAMGYSEESGIPFGDGITKNRYIGRTFIQPEQSMRQKSVRIKLNALRSNVSGKRIIIVDDSIVRGTTSRNLVDMLRQAGAKEVHMRISSPQVKYSCTYGIDTNDPRHLMAANHSVEQMRSIIGADSLAFLDIDDLLAAAKGTSVDFCGACFTNEYPLSKAGLE